MKTTLAAILILLVTSAVPAHSGDGKGKFVFDAWNGPALTVYITTPPELAAMTPVVLVMHGMSRNADDYRDQWHELALKHGFLLVVPEFSRAHFPTSRSYNTGNVWNEEDQFLPRSEWSFNAIEALFDDVRQRFGLQATHYALYGHSAGSQFVHRFLLHVPEARVNRAVAANAGWYTVPDHSVAFPYGLQGSRVGEAAVRKFLARPLTVLLGDRDTLTDQDNLRQTPEAQAQGPHRLARGWHFFDTARRAAQALDAKFNWRLATVPGAHHDNALMAPEAVRYLLPDR